MPWNVLSSQERFVEILACRRQSKLIISDTGSSTGERHDEARYEICPRGGIYSALGKGILGGYVLPFVTGGTVETFLVDVASRNSK